ncbi:MAG TPA: metallophosphoesterase [Acidimicrobiales bacterium]
MAVALHPPRRRVMVALVAVVALVVAAVGLLYHDPIYRYLTHIKGSPTETAAWAPLPDGEAPDLHLAVVGDVGDGGRRIDATGAAVARLDDRLPVDGLVVVGDNVYPSGNPAGLARTVFEPFAPVLDHAALYAVLGNHDVKRDNAVGQVAALGMPGRWWAEHLGDVLLVGLDSNVVDDPAQRAWLEETLASATERWRIVVVHHPPYSAGYQGSSTDVRDAFAPLFERYGVQLVLSGHDHDYQRSVPIGGVTYVVTGGASGTRRTGEDDFTAVSFSWHHFTEVAVFPDRIVVRAVNQDLRVADEATIRG